MANINHQNHYHYLNILLVILINQHLMIIIIGHIINHIIIIILSDFVKHFFIHYDYHIR